jgi:hypothetical protein
MFVEVYGVRGKLKRKLQDFTEWLGYELMGERLASNVEVTVIVSKFEGCERGFYGFAEYQDCNIRPREFIVRINKTIPEQLILETLAHEMVHVKQEAKGEKQERFRGGHRLLWKGKDHTKTSYNRQPWEREAYRLEKKLVERYFAG